MFNYDSYAGKYHKCNNNYNTVVSNYLEKLIMNFYLITYLKIYYIYKLLKI